MSTRYKLLFRGQVAADHHESVVRARLQKLLKASDAQLAVMFSGKPVTIKKDADETTVERYLDAFVKAGAKLEIVELDAEALAAAARKAEMEVAAKAHKAELAKTAEQSSAPEVAPEPVADSTQASALAHPAPLAPAEATADAFDLAEVGSDMVPAEAKMPEPVAEVTTDHLSLSEAGGNIMASTEITQPQSAPSLDISHLKLDEPGVTLGTPKSVAPAIDPLGELNFELGEVGEQLVANAPPVVAELPDLGHFELEELPAPAEA